MVWKSDLYGWMLEAWGGDGLWDILGRGKGREGCGIVFRNFSSWDADGGRVLYALKDIWEWFGLWCCAARRRWWGKGGGREGEGKPVSGKRLSRLLYVTRLLA